MFDWAVNFIQGLFYFFITSRRGALGTPSTFASSCHFMLHPFMFPMGDVLGEAFQKITVAVLGKKPGVFFCFVLF